MFKTLFILLYLSSMQDALVITLKSNERILACITDRTDETVAFVASNPADFEPNVEFLDSRGKQPDMKLYDCNLVKSNGCKNWDIGTFENKSNLQNGQDELPPVIDYRWHDFQPIYTKNKSFSEIKSFGKSSNFSAHFSILASESVQFGFSKTPTFDEGYSIVIDGWKGKKSSIRYCSHLSPKDNEDHSTCNVQYKKVTDKSFLFKGKNWALFAVHFLSFSKIINISVESNKSVLMKANGINDGNTNGWYFGVKTTQVNGVFRLQKYQTLQSNQGSQLRRLINATEDLCVDVVYFIKDLDHDETNEIFKLEISKQTAIFFNQTIKSALMSEWKVGKFMWNNTLPGTYNLTITALKKGLVIGGIRFCSTGDLVVKPNSTKFTFCQQLSLSTYNNGNFNQAHYFLEKKLAKLSESFCTNLINKSCSGLKAFSDSSWSCLPGYSGTDCNQVCSGKSYGPNCTSESNRFCKENNVNGANGYCSDGCDIGYLPPDCTHECTGKYYGENCSFVTMSFCKDNKINRTDGTCLEGCKVGFMEPECKECVKKKYGLNCENVVERFCKDDEVDKTYGKCINGCMDGYKEPECINSVHFTDYSVFSYMMPITLIILLGIVVFFAYAKLRRRRMTKEEIETQTSDQDLAFAMEALDEHQLDEVSEQHRSIISSRNVSVERQLDHQDNSAVAVTEFDFYFESALSSGLLKSQFERFPRGQTQAWTIGTSAQNRKKNRYGNLAAYDTSRVVLSLLPGDEYSDYINANFIDDHRRPKAYIATQGPKAQTVNDFWRMIWQEKVTQIVMVTNLEEDGKIKCEKYWPDVFQSKQFAGVVVNNAEEEIHAEFVVRTLSISSGQENRLIQHLHFTNWPDHDVPLYPQSMLIFVEKMMQHKSKGPVTVHCSAGVGRTGAVILIDACLRMALQEGFVDVVKIFAKMRSQRANLVDNLNQYEFVHLVLLEAIAIPKLTIPCSQFATEYSFLMDFDKLQEYYERLGAVCQRDWMRAEKQAEIQAEKCRYPDIISSSAYLVRLFPYGHVTEMSFVNAVFVDGYQQKKQFIATQVPMENTVAHFWRMIHQYNVEQIIILNEPHISDGVFLPTVDRKFVFGDLEVVFDRTQEDDNFQINTIKTFGAHGSSKVVSVISLFGWDAQECVAPKVNLLINLWAELKTSKRGELTAVVCSDGVTACGLFLGIGFVIEKIKLEQQVDVALAVRTLRKSRPLFILNQLQFEALYNAAYMYLLSFDTYGNFKLS
ncbi:uncharacterized protein LOC132200097 isoform X2 [Neocloeon triangulifer]|uniref:uncharacterized protein LOC132200097 isoform X2 n=1 Tax=Neocloeon triangulifer TaxID=2078957 RepID=UPI00286F0393|nr:uncharacterized protein LOC132200097 isoform X2 [Neocloeon triangulifer]